MVFLSTLVSDTSEVTFDPQLYSYHSLDEIRVDTVARGGEAESTAKKAQWEY